MDCKFGCTVDVNKFYVAYGRIILEDDTAVETIVGYNLKLGERVVALPYPCGLIRARANEDDTRWLEAATPEEIVTWEQEHLTPVIPPTPTLDQRTAALEAAVLAMIGGDASV